MSSIPDPNAPSIRDAEAKLERLGVQVEAMQAVLVRLLQDVVRAESRLEHSQAASLVEANEQLVVAAMASQAEAQAAAEALRNAPPATSIDALTRLPNRPALLDRFAQAVAHARRNGSRFALLFVDLDNFKQLNDSQGHTFGDQVLCLVAERMVGVVREIDTVSRHGGDEFLILLDQLKQPGDAQAVAEKLLAAIALPAELEGLTIRLSASIGIAVYPDDGEDSDTLIARADTAMYSAKRSRPGGVAFAAGTTGDAAPMVRTVPTLGLAPVPADAAAPNPAAQVHAMLREANEKLVLAAISAQQLQDAAELAQQRQTAFMAAVADELSNPQAPIRIATAMLGRGGADEPLLPRVRSIVEQQLGQMSRLVGQLVDASNLGHGGLQLELRRVDLGAVVDAALASHRTSMVARGQHFEMQRPDGPLWVHGDAARLEQAIGNLLDNASKYTRDGGRIRLSISAGDATLTLRLADNGIGISPTMLPRIFEPFDQDALALGLNGAGLGIGLTVALALVRAHGGELVAHSAGAQRGSEFVLTLPSAPGGPDAVLGAASAAAPPTAAQPDAGGGPGADPHVA